MGVEIVRERDLVDLGEDVVDGGSKITAFEYQYPLDLEKVLVERRLLGLDGAEPAPYTFKEKSVIATRLRSLGFLTDNEIEILGGKIVKTDYKKV